MSRVSKDLLDPLNRALERWSDEFKVDDSHDESETEGEDLALKIHQISLYTHNNHASSDHLHDALMPLSALDTALERVDEAKAKLGL